MPGRRRGSLQGPRPSSWRFSPPADPARACRVLTSLRTGSRSAPASLQGCGAGCLRLTVFQTPHFLLRQILPFWVWPKDSARSSLSAENKRTVAKRCGRRLQRPPVSWSAARTPPVFHTWLHLGHAWRLCSVSGERSGNVSLCSVTSSPLSSWGFCAFPVGPPSDVSPSCGHSGRGLPLRHTPWVAQCVQGP